MAEDGKADLAKQYEPMFHAAPVGMLITTLGRKIVTCNPAYCALYGYTTDELRGRDTAMFYARREDYEEFGRTHFNPTAEATVTPYTVEMRRKDGSTLLAEVVGSVIKDADGRAVTYFAIHTDMTERLRAAEALRSRDAQLQLLADSLPVLIAYVDREKRYRFNNKTYESWLGVAPEAMRGNLVAEVLGPEKYAAIDEPLDAVLGGSEVTFETRIPRPDGDDRFVLVNYVPDTDEDGDVRGAFAIITDITEREAAANALRAARDEADRANAAKSRFLAAASHDLRQPLQTMVLLLDVLRDTVEPDERERLIDNIGEATKMANSLLGALLDISQLDAGALKPAWLDFPIEDLLRRVERAHRHQAEDRGLTLRVVPCSAVVRSDEALLERVVDNLVANAVAHTKAGRILVGCRRRGDRLAVEVWDTGIGIAHAEREAIFEEFYQINDPALERGKGLGLGLTIVRRIAALLGHDVTVSSVPGRGSVFAVEIPLGDALRARQEADRVDALSAGRIRGKKVMVIEDDIDVLQSTTRVLEHWGADVLPARTVAEAVRQTNGRAPDLIITDYRLPDAPRGIADLRQVRDAMQQPPPLIVITGDTGIAALQDIEASGHPFLHKPVAVAKLRRLIESLLRA